MSLRKDLKEILREAEGQGWRVEEGSKNHKLYSPDGEGLVIVAKTPSDPRGLKNAVARMRRYGFQWKGR